MRDFFRGWKRKLGCVTLVMACAFMVGWMRSLYFIDFVTLPDINQSSDSINSYQGKLMWMRVVHPWRNPNQSNSYQLHSIAAGAGNPSLMINNGNWKWYVCGFGFRESSDPWQQIETHAIPYWSTVLPLTAISAWLLLSKPRARIDRPPTPASENA